MYKPQHFLEEEKCLRKGLKGTASRDFLLQFLENQRPHGEMHRTRHFNYEQTHSKREELDKE